VGAGSRGRTQLHTGPVTEGVPAASAEHRERSTSTRRSAVQGQEGHGCSKGCQPLAPAMSRCWAAAAGLHHLRAQLQLTCLACKCPLPHLRPAAACATPAVPPRAARPAAARSTPPPRRPAWHRPAGPAVGPRCPAGVDGRGGPQECRCFARELVVLHSVVFCKSARGASFSGALQECLWCFIQWLFCKSACGASFSGCFARVLVVLHSAVLCKSACGASFSGCFARVLVVLRSVVLCKSARVLVVLRSAQEMTRLSIAAHGTSCAGAGQAVACGGASTFLHMRCQATPLCGCRAVP